MDVYTTEFGNESPDNYVSTNLYMQKKNSFKKKILYDSSYEHFKVNVEIDTFVEKTCFVSLSKTVYPLLSTGSTMEDQENALT